MTVASGNQPRPTLTPEQTATRDAAIEADYRAGLKPVRQIGRDHGLSHTAIQKMAKDRGWVRDLSAKIQAEADAKVARAAVAKEVADGNRIPEKVVVDANASQQFQVRMAHRNAIQRSRELLERLLGEVEALPTDPAAIEQLVKAAGDELSADDRAELKRKLLHVASTGGRLTLAKQVVDVLERVVNMERQAYSIKIEALEQRDDPLSMLLREVQSRRSALPVVPDAE